MRDVPFEINGIPLTLRLTAGALFDLYDRFGVRGSVLQASGAAEDTEEGRLARTALAALLAEQGELWRRRQGHDPREIPPAGAFLAERPDTLLATLRQAMTAGFARAVPSVEDDGEVNLVLAARNDEAADSAERLRAVFLTVCAARLHLAPADALLLTPGEYLDMVTLLGGKEADDGSQDDYN